MHETRLLFLYANVDEGPIPLAVLALNGSDVSMVWEDDLIMHTEGATRTYVVSCLYFAYMLCRGIRSHEEATDTLHEILEDGAIFLKGVVDITSRTPRPGRAVANEWLKKAQGARTFPPPD